ncbi:hypothetical protein Pan54_32790 [Rubinisphaera italica]|uniref:Uncharacterized protein n=1 Tax=Rubinisphaera italica TaxID=2527969 RepID=A0A5C5XHH0_9PLAN|nr:hypothetical protein Pan54_32790 [Rubinisphaera italica]
MINNLGASLRERPRHPAENPNPKRQRGDGYPVIQ